MLPESETKCFKNHLIVTDIELKSKTLNKLMKNRHHKCFIRRQSN